jgi:hypothetical protein
LVSECTTDGPNVHVCPAIVPTNRSKLKIVFIVLTLSGC